MKSLKILILASIFILLFTICCIAQNTLNSKKQILLMNRVGPSNAELFVANADGTGEHPLLSKSGFDYHASYSANGQWISFTSERTGLGQADIYRVHPDGSALERLTDSPALDDQSALSPNGTKLAFVSTRQSHTTNIWILDIKDKKLVMLTGKSEIQGDPTKPDGFFHPSWSPDGKWIAFSSDRNTQWLGHGNGSGWEHVQELSIYIIHPDGTGFRRITKTGLCDGAPKWSPDSKKLVFYEIAVEDTWAARRPNLAGKVASQIFSIDINSGEKIALTAGPGLKVLPQYLDSEKIGYLLKAGPNAGLAYIGGLTIKGSMRSPYWSPDGKNVVYEKVDFTHRTQNLPLYSWDSNYDYRYTDVFPNFSKDGKLVVTDKDFDSGISIMNADGSNKQKVFTPTDGDVAFMPTWSPDGQWIAFGYGGFLQSRKTRPAKIMMIKRDGTGIKALTEGMPNAGFPSFSPDGKKIVYRSWGAENDGLRILNLEDKSVKILTTEYDNLPFWSPDGKLISFTRRHDANNFDIYSIKPDGTDLHQLTTSPANDAHAFWTTDSKHLMWSSGVNGFKDEVTLYDNNFQPYGAIFIMNADGTDKKQLTDSPWEDSMPVFAPANFGRK